LATPFAGPDGTQKGGHTSAVLKMGVRANGEIVTIGRDDHILVSSPDGVYGTKTKLDMSCGSMLVAVATVSKELNLTNGAAIEATVPLDASPTCLSVSPDDMSIAVGDEENNITIYDGKGVVKGAKLQKHKGPLSCVAFSPDSTKLASGCAQKELVVWNAADGSPLVSGLQGFHTTRLSCLAWSSAGILASGGVDSTIFVWTPESLGNGKPHSTAKLTHTAGGVNALIFASENLLVSAGADACIKFWKL